MFQNQSEKMVCGIMVVFNLPTEINKIEEGQKLQGIKGKNTSRKLGYQGPCPPDREHRYFFKMYALDTIIKLPEGATKNEVEKTIEGHVIEKAELIGLYKSK